MKFGVRCSERIRFEKVVIKAKFSLVKVFYYVIISFVCMSVCVCAGVAELADASDLGSDTFRRAGSNPVTRTTWIIVV